MKIVIVSAPSYSFVGATFMHCPVVLWNYNPMLCSLNCHFTLLFPNQIYLYKAVSSAFVQASFLFLASNVPSNFISSKNTISLCKQKL